MMMKPIGNSLTAAVILVLALAANTALAAVTASVDRNRVALGDTLRLTITATDDEDLDAGQLQALQNDFDILQRSTSSNTSIINGRVSQSRKLVVDLAPRREGNFQIPRMQFGQSTTPSLTVAVEPASDTPDDGQSVIFEIDVDQDEVYVQGQVILTMRVQQAVNLEGRSLSAFNLDNAFVKPLEQRSFQRVIDGRPWRVDEIRYAIFPERSGTLEIPAQVFSGRIDRGRRSFFDIGGGGQIVRRSTQPITLSVLPKPASYPPADWLPAEQLTLQETWSTPPEQLRVGESVTRTVRIVGDGLQGAQLPPILFTPPDGLKYYPDQPSISEQEIPSGLEGIREDSAAIVPTSAGTYVIPEIRIPWWDTKTGELRYAVLPSREITATGTLPSTANNTSEAMGDTGNAVAPPMPSSPIDIGSTAIPGSASVSKAELTFWRALAVVSTLGWGLTLFYLWRKRARKTPVKAVSADVLSEKKAFKALLSACEQGSTARARAAVIAWAATLTPGTAAVSLEQVGHELGDEQFRQLLGQLDEALYRSGDSSWDGSALSKSAQRVRAEHVRTSRSNEAASIELYPSTR